MFSVKFKVKDGRNSLPRSSSRSSQRSSSPSSTRSSRSRSTDRTKITKITKNGQVITTVIDGKLKHGNLTVAHTKYVCINGSNIGHFYTNQAKTLKKTKRKKTFTLIDFTTRLFTFAHMLKKKQKRSHSDDLGI